MHAHPLGAAALVLAALLPAAGTAQTHVDARSTAAAVLGGFTIQLVDLDPDDGITPRLTWLDDGRAGAVAGTQAGWSWYDVGHFVEGEAGDAGDRAWASTTARAMTRRGDALAGVGGNGRMTGATLSAYGSIAPRRDTTGCGWGYCARPDASFSAWVQVPDAAGLAFSLTPATQLVISAQFGLLGAAEGGGLWPWNLEGPVEIEPTPSTASAAVWLSLAGGGAAPAVDARSLAVQALWDPLAGTWADAALSDAGWLSVSFANVAGLAVQGWFGAGAEVAGFSANDAFLAANLSAVPEAPMLALWLAGLAVLGMSIATRPAAAASRATAAVSGLTVTLHDLDPDDGLAPSIVFDAQAGNGADLSAWVWSSADDNVKSTRVLDAIWQSATVSVAGRLGEGSASARGHGRAQGAGVWASGHALGAVDGDVTYFDVSTRGPTYYPQNFILGPGTGVTFGARMAASLQVDVGRDAEGLGEYALSSALLVVSGPGADGSLVSDREQYTLFVDWDAHCHPVTGVCAGSTQSMTGMESVSFANGSDAPVEGTLTMYAAVRGHSELRPVPEAPAAALLAGGLLGLRLLSRRAAVQPSRSSTTSVR